MSKILYISSEAFPLVKTGGLGDVAGSLPIALQKHSQDVRLLLPAYPQVLQHSEKCRRVAQTSYYNLPVEILETRLPGSRVTVWLVDCPALFNRPGGPYSDTHGLPWHDNALRFAVFCHAAVDIALNQLQLAWQPEVVHCNDWQSGLVPALLQLHANRPATIFTIHNLAYQGLFDRQTFDELHLPHSLWHMGGLEFHGQLSFIKGGLAYADKITTVSATYAREILQPEYGYGLDGLLRHRVNDLCGILNGVDEKQWNPGTDSNLVQKYNRRTLAQKVKNKTALQHELKLPVDEGVAMIGMVSRLVEQKGLETILQSLPALAEMALQLVVLGTGDTHYEMQLADWSQRHPDKIKILIGYNEMLSHRIIAASDLYLMPSNFEPCGLSQLYSLRYGTLPIVTNVGGLVDTVTDASEENIANAIADGFVMSERTAASLVSTVQYALSRYQQAPLWGQLQRCAMSHDFSWQESASHYIELYEELKKTN